MGRSYFPHGVHLRGVPLIYITNLVNQLMSDFGGFEECINLGPAQVWGWVMATAKETFTGSIRSPLLI